MYQQGAIDSRVNRKCIITSQIPNGNCVSRDRNLENKSKVLNELVYAVIIESKIEIQSRNRATITNYIQLNRRHKKPLE